MDGHAVHVRLDLGVGENLVSPFFHVISVLVVNQQSRCAMPTILQGGTEVLLNEISLRLWVEMHALPLTAVSIRLVHRSQPPKLHAFGGIGIEILSKVFSVDRIVLWLEPTAGALPIVFG